MAFQVSPECQAVSSTAATLCEDVAYTVSSLCGEVSYTTTNLCASLNSWQGYTLDPGENWQNVYLMWNFAQ